MKKREIKETNRRLIKLLSQKLKTNELQNKQFLKIKWELVQQKVRK